MTRRLLISYLSLAVLILLLLEVPLAVFFDQREEERFLADAERDAVVLASFYTESMRTDLPLDASVANSFANRTGVRVLLVNADGISVLDTTQVVPRDYSTRDEIEVALTGLSDNGIRRSETLGIELAYVAVPVASAGTVFGAIRLTADVHEVTERVHKFWYGLAGIAIVVLLAVCGVGWAVARSVTRPLRDLRTSAMRFADGNLSSSDLPHNAPSEIRELGETMNNMARRLDELIESQRSFVGDASHQLRTPLTALRLRLENVEASGADSSIAHDLTAAINETERLSDLVESLLRLARAEEHPETEVVDLTIVTRDRVDTWQAVAEAKSVDLALMCRQDSVAVFANAGAIEQILDNLLDNALGVSPTGSTITIRIEQLHEVAKLSISDEGPGLDDDGKIRALERFWRGDHNTPGTGLGLAIAEALAVASGGSLLLLDNTDVGLCVVITLDSLPS